MTDSSTFERLSREIRSRLLGTSYAHPVGELFTSAPNLEYIFGQYVKRFEAATGFEIDPATHRFDIFASLIYDIYREELRNYAGTLPRQRRGETETLDERWAVASAVDKWNEATVEWIVGEALRAAENKTKHLRRVRDCNYGRASWQTMAVVRPHERELERRWVRLAEQESCRRPPPSGMVYLNENC